MKGNALDMAAGTMIGAATSNCGIFLNTVADFVLPPFAVFPGGQAG